MHRYYPDKEQTRTRPQWGIGSDYVSLVGLTRLDSNKYKTLIRRRRQFVHSPTSIRSEVEVSGNRVIDKFGEIAVKRLEQLYRKDFSEDDIELILSSYQARGTTIDLAKQFGCSKGTINKLLRKYGVNVTKAKARAKLEDGVVVAMYEEERHTIEEIAKHFGVSPYTVNRCLHSNGVKIRSRWDYVKK